MLQMNQDEQRLWLSTLLPWEQLMKLMDVTKKIDFTLGLEQQEQQHNQMTPMTFTVIFIQ